MDASFSFIKYLLWMFASSSTWAAALPCRLAGPCASGPQTLIEQSRRMVHISNLYYHEPQGRLAEQIVRLLAPARCSSPTRAARPARPVQAGPQIRTRRRPVRNSRRAQFLSRPDAGGIAATGQDKVEVQAMVARFRHVPFNDLGRCARPFPSDGGHHSQRVGAGGITPATPEYTAWTARPVR